MPEKEKILDIAIKNLESFLDFRKERLQTIRNYEDMYFGKKKEALKGRFNILVPILEGFVNTLESKIDDPIRVTFKPGKESAYKTAKKINALYEKDSAQDRGNYSSKDLDAKKFAIFSGFAVLKLIPSSNPYKQDLEAIDYYDFIFDPLGGRDLDNHYFKGQINILKTESEIKKLAGKIYDKDAVSKLVGFKNSDYQYSIDQNLKEKLDRYSGLGLKFNFDKYSVGERIFNLCEMFLKVEGEDYYILFSPHLRIALRVEKLENISSAKLHPYVAWHFERNPSSFFCKSPLDAVYPISEAMRILINQNFDNIQKRNWDMIIYNANKIDNPADFEYRPNGLIRARLDYGESMANVYSKLETPETSSITINLLQFFDAFIGMKTGITPATQGIADEEKVGIYYGNLEQVSDRFGLLNKFYSEAYVKLGIRYIANLKDYLPDGYSVKMIGLFGYEDDKIFREELDNEFIIDVSSSTIERQINEIVRKKQQESLLMVLKDPELRNKINKNWVIKEILRLGEFDENTIKEALSEQDEVSEEILSEASKAIEEILQGKKPRLYNRANTDFIRKIIYFATENVEDDIKYANLMNYAIEHIPIAERNARFSNKILSRLNSNQQPMPENNKQIMVNEF
ncbi:MAG: hypothetical protein N2Z85_02075 [Patescibacteria group bacterium]|nr:hypothetical protein [Patescibacteria group bacterium]